MTQPHRIATVLAILSVAAPFVGMLEPMSHETAGRDAATTIYADPGARGVVELDPCTAARHGHSVRFVAPWHGSSLRAVTPSGAVYKLTGGTEPGRDRIGPPILEMLCLPDPQPNTEGRWYPVGRGDEVTVSVEGTE